MKIDLDLVVARLRQGASLREVSRDLGVSYGPVYSRLKSRDIRVLEVVASDAFDRLEGLAADGCNQGEVRAALGLTSAALKNLLRRYRRLRGGIAFATRRLPPEAVEHVRGWSASGKTQQQIADLLLANYGVRLTQPSVARLVARYKIEPRGRQLPPVRGWVDLATAARGWLDLATAERRTPKMW